MNPAPAPWAFSLRQRWRNWWIQRLPASDTSTLTHRNLYILPTRAGLMLGLTLVILLIASINYQLNLGYLLTFLLTGCAAVAMHVAHNNLRGLQLKLSASSSAFAGSAAAVHITLANPGRRARYGLHLRWANSPGPQAAASEGAWADVPVYDTASVHLRFPTAARGRQALPAVLVETRFPIGSFRVWSWWRAASTLLVYPAPETPTPPLPTGVGEGAPPLPHHRGENDELDSLRPWRAGDPLKRVLWKKAAQQPEPHQWISRDFSTPPAGQLWLEAAQCGLPGLEAQLSRLCAWVLEAEKQHLVYGLKLPGQTIAPGQGPLHQQQCLEALALC